ncbi:MAG: hypothetical protein E4G98_00075 [Promethearchaeota archaeon]|nr:MAG: hypothetical protein E4G98_00075 [Candidatus Lokiarchaeota archaeon]
MDVSITRKATGYVVKMKDGFFRKHTYSDPKFEQMIESFGEFFETRSRTKELRQTTLRIGRKKYQLQEELRGTHISGVITRKKSKMTWAFLCYLNEQIQEMLRSEEPNRKFSNQAY